MKRLILIAKARVANWRSNRGYINNVSFDEQDFLDMVADEARRNLENYYDEREA